MKLSLSWIFDHIDGDWTQYDITEIVKSLNNSTAEIEHVYKVTFDPELFTIGIVTSREKESVSIRVPEYQQEAALPLRSDLEIGSSYLMVKNNAQYRWAELKDMHSEKEGLVPALKISIEQAQDGAWKKELEVADYIIALDNKSITHRSDLWGHRGFAREVAAALDLPFIEEDYFLAQKAIRHADNVAHDFTDLPIDLKIASKTCNRLAALSIPRIAYEASIPFYALRLARIDARPIDLIVDATNYVMYDWGYPIHAFDAEKVHGELVARNAFDDEKLTVLDKETLPLRHSDCVIADKDHSLSLAGVMGGISSAVSKNTRSLIIEAAHFDPGAIRLTATHFKKRTESSVRFEKSLDPYQNTQAILRYLKILEDAQVEFTASDAIVSLGILPAIRSITIDHGLITSRLGVYLSSEYVIKTLTKIGFGVKKLSKPEITYEITIPTFRVSKDVSHKEDIIEEIGRFYGFSNIQPHLPRRNMRPFSVHALQRRRLIKNFYAYSLLAHEVSNYALYDEDFLKTWTWEPSHAIHLKNPLSEARKRLVTSLIPHLIKNVYDNAHAHDEIVSFFEMNRTWSSNDANPIENLSCAFIASAKYRELDFYAYKLLCNQLFTELHMLVEWRKPTVELAPWYSKYQTAELVCDGTIVGYAGMGSAYYVQSFLGKSTFICELDARILLQHQGEERYFETLSKYQSVTFDVSMLADAAISVADLEHALAHVDPRIKEVQLVDYFTKAEWGSRRSITIRCLVVDHLKTLTKSEIDEITTSAREGVAKLGVEIR